MGLIEDLVAAISAINGLTGFDKNIYKNTEKIGDVLCDIQDAKTIDYGIGSGAPLVLRPFTLEIHSDTAANLATYEAAIKAALNKTITNGFWRIINETPDFKEKRKNRILIGFQMKVES